MSPLPIHLRVGIVQCALCDKIIHKKNDIADDDKLYEEQKRIFPTSKDENLVAICETCLLMLVPEGTKFEDAMPELKKIIQKLQDSNPVP